MIHGAFLMTSESRCISLNGQKTSSSEENLNSDCNGEKDAHYSDTKIEVMPNGKNDDFVGDNEQLQNIIKMMNSKMQ